MNNNHLLCLAPQQLLEDGICQLKRTQSLEVLIGSLRDEYHKALDHAVRLKDTHLQRLKEDRISLSVVRSEEFKRFYEMSFEIDNAYALECHDLDIASLDDPLVDFVCGLFSDHPELSGLCWPQWKVASALVTVIRSPDMNVSQALNVIRSGGFDLFERGKEMPSLE
jgi:hypothetical protein